MTSLIIDPGKFVVSLQCSVLYTKEHLLNIIDTHIDYIIIPISRFKITEQPTMSTRVLLLVKDSHFDLDGDEDIVTQSMKEGRSIIRYSDTVAQKCEAEFEQNFWLKKVGNFYQIKRKGALSRFRSSRKKSSILFG